jgi:phosphoglycerate dehydrogenase-like enzyme
MPRRLVVDLRSEARVWRIPESVEARLVATAPPGWEVTVVHTDTVSDGDGGQPPTPEALAAVAEAEVYFGYGVPEALLTAAPGLRWVHTATAGVGATLHAAMRASDVQLTNSAGIHAVPMAEYVLAGLMHLWRGLDVARAQQASARWSREFWIDGATPVREVGESAVLIVGTGGIGRELAMRLSALGATCVGVRRRPQLGAPPGFARVVGVDALDEALPRCDAVVLAAPATPGTVGLLTAARLDLLPVHAVVVNVARGSLLDQEALVARLQAGRLRGAVLDVFDPEPLAADSPLWHLPQVLVTPHVSAVTPRRFWEREAALFMDNWGRYVRGQPLRNLVDKDAGY